VDAAAAISYASTKIARTQPNLRVLTPAGEFQRGCELVSTLVIVAVDPHPKGENRTNIAGDSLTVHITAKDRYGITLLLVTGSDQHIAALGAAHRSWDHPGRDWAWAARRDLPWKASQLDRGRVGQGGTGPWGSPSRKDVS